MSTSVSESGSEIEITMTGGGMVRLFGLPFLLVGAWFGYHLVLGTAYLVTGRVAVGETLFGLLLLTLMTVAFLVPGWMLLFARALVRIDRHARTVTATRDLRLCRLTEQHALTDFTRIEVDLLSVSTTRRSRSRSCQVELARARGAAVLVGVFDDGEEAVTLAHRLSGMTGLPVRDKRHTERAGSAGV